VANTVVVGLQWGDEGKGKIVDLLCPAFDAVVRFQGGHNAGHTVRFRDRHFALQLIPSGICHPGLDCVLGNGMVVAPEALFDELGRLAEAGVETAGRLFLSSRAHLLLPAHAALDQAREAAAGRDQIGTTARGIGPAYEAKTSRAGLRLGDLLEPSFADRLAFQLARIDAELRSLGVEERPSFAAIHALCEEWAERLAPFVTDTGNLLHGWLDAGRRLLFEGAQGALLDVDHGTYPFVTSSNTVSGTAASGSGLGPSATGFVLGIVKAYTTRVFGTVTGRKRRCGWFDAVLVRQAIKTSGIQGIALTKLDILDGLEEIKICVGYTLDGKHYDYLPPHAADQARVEPIYESIEGWSETTAGARSWAQLPAQAIKYIRRIEELIQCPVTLVSTSPQRDDTILVRDPFED